MPNTQKTLLPFISSQDPDSTTLTMLRDDVEKAIAFCLAELDRQKGGGVFKKQTPEKIIFVSKAYYPFWVVKFLELTLIFDGLDLNSHPVMYPSFPDIATFQSNLNHPASRQIYVNFLSDNLNYFEGSNGEQTKTVEGLITDSSFLTELLEYLKEAKTTAAVVNGVLISPTHNEEQIMEKINDLENLRTQLIHELEELNKIIKILNTQTQEALAALRDEIKTIGDKFGVQIEKAKGVLEEKRSQINKKYSDKVADVSDKFEQKLIGLHKEIITLQKTQEQIVSDIANVENEIKTATVNKDEAAEQKYKEKRNELKNQIPETTTAIKNLGVKVQETEENKKNTLFQLKQENDAALKEAGKKLLEIEASRDAEIKTCQDEMEKIEDLSSSIINKIDQLTKLSEAAITEFDNLGAQTVRKNNLLVYMPFYLICYQSGASKRCAYLPPSIMNGSGIGARLRALGKKKVTHFCQPRSQKIISFLNAFLRLLDENVAFNHEINEACGKANLIGSKNDIESITNGLNQLKTDNWLSNSEFESFSQQLRQMFP